MKDSFPAAALRSFCVNLCPSGVAEFGSISCGETICGTAWADANTRDTDWYIFTNDGDEPVNAVLTITSQLPMITGPINSTDCATASAIDPFVTTGFCGTATLTLCLPVGDTWFFAGSTGFAGFPCGANNDYSLSLDCSGPCEIVSVCPNLTHDCCTTGTPGCSDQACCELALQPRSVLLQHRLGYVLRRTQWLSPRPSATEACGLDCGGGGGSSCCVANGGVGCDDATCQSTVCACDPFCCTTSWDSLCAGEGFVPGCGAAILCPELCGGGGGGSSCCVANGGVGCDDATCQSTVCACDPFCCTTSWDSLCAGEGFVPGCGAAILCPELCGG